MVHFHLIIFYRQTKAEKMNTQEEDMKWKVCHGGDVRRSRTSGQGGGRMQGVSGDAASLWPERVKAPRRAGAEPGQSSPPSSQMSLSRPKHEQLLLAHGVFFFLK